MWINRDTYDRMQQELAELRGVNKTLDNQNTGLHGTIEWAMTRLTGIEKERAQLIERYMGITLEVPTYAPAPGRLSARTPSMDVPPMMGVADIFKDVGDEEAAKLGIGWDASGNVTRTQ